MPKLSNARRHRRQLDLAGYCVNQTPRKVSEEDIQEHTSSTEDTAESPALRDTLLAGPPRLTRREPSTCLSDLCLHTPLPKVPSLAGGGVYRECEEEHPDSSGGEIGLGRTVSPVWGHFVDVILDDDEVSPRPSRLEKEDPMWSATSYSSHSPYGAAARRRLRLRSPQRSTSGGGDQLSGFVLQDPSTLQDALSRLSV